MVTTTVGRTLRITPAMDSRISREYSSTPSGNPRMRRSPTPTCAQACCCSLARMRAVSAGSVPSIPASPEVSRR